MSGAGKTGMRPEPALCFHCGQICAEQVYHNDRMFCCSGCKLVFQLLAENNMLSYYKLESHPGTKQEAEKDNRWEFLEVSEVREAVLATAGPGAFRVTFHIPQVHCSACVWLLENLHKLDPGIASARVRFLAKEATIVFRESETSLRKIVELLDSIGYAPQLNLEHLGVKAPKTGNARLPLKLGVAGFAFGNIMLLSLPEYLAGGMDLSPGFKTFFAWLNLVIALPVLFFSAQDFFISAFRSLKQKFLNIDVPIALGIVALFGQSLFEIVTQTGPGYFDSFAGLIFFLLIGKVFQQKTYAALSFERNYKSYFPISVTRIEESGEQSIPLTQLKINDMIRVRNGELIPADALLLSENGAVDYAFVTGESDPVQHKKGEQILAGGRVHGKALRVHILKNVSQSRLTQLWNHDVFKTAKNSALNSLSNVVAKYFTITILAIATIAAVFWAFLKPESAISVFTAILIVACPCALALTVPFTFGHAMRIFGRNHFYLKNADVTESLAKVDHVVFDKTGTITRNNQSRAVFVAAPDSPENLSDFEKQVVASVASNSSHPLSAQIVSALSVNDFLKNSDFQEMPGRGVVGLASGSSVKLGSAAWVAENFDTSRVEFSNKHLKNESFREKQQCAEPTPTPSPEGNLRDRFAVAQFHSREGSGVGKPTLSNTPNSRYLTENIQNENSSETRVHLAIDGHYRGYFRIQHAWRGGLKNVIAALKDQFAVSLLSGDAPRAINELRKIFGKARETETLRFEQSPEQKMAFIHDLQKRRGEKILMLGDGLNDAGALKQSDVGVAISEDIHAFSPACDAILDAKRFRDLPKLLRFAKSSTNVVKAGFTLSFLYNIVGLSFAITGNLSPLIAAILMPISSITVVAFATGATQWRAKRAGL